MSIGGSFLRLLAMGVVTAIVAGVVLFFLRQVGLSQVVLANSNPLLSSPFLFLARGDTDRAPAFSRQGFAAALQAHEKVILVADLRPTKDMNWIIYGRASLDEYTTGRGPVEALTLDDLKRLTLRPLAAQSGAETSEQRLLSLEEFLQEFPQARLAFVIHSREAIGSAALLDRLRSRLASSETLIFSPYHSMIREIRRKQPNWVFASDPATLARVRFLNAIFLEPVADIWPDIISSPLRVTKTIAIPPRLVDELRRRNKPIVLEVDQTDDVPQYLLESLGGVLTNRAGWAAKEFSSRLSP